MTKKNNQDKLEFYGGKGMSLIPLIILVLSGVYFFAFAGVYDTVALAVGGIIALIVGSFLFKNG